LPRTHHQGFFESHGGSHMSKHTVRMSVCL
jgi:hypothetical protein